MNLLTAYLTRPATQRIMRKKPGQEGFSLIELVVVIAVLAILAVIALPNFQGVTQSASAQSMKTALADIYKQCYVMRSRGTPANNRVILAPVIADVTFSPLVGITAAVTTETTHVNCAGAVAGDGIPAVIGVAPTAGGVLAGVVPTFQLQVASGNKVCSGVADFGCSSAAGGTW